MSPLRRLLHRYNAVQWVILVWVLAVSVAIGYLVAGRINDVREQRQAAVGFCSQAKASATADVPATSSELGRNLVRISAGAYQIGHCEQITGPLGDVDPDAFRPAPSQSPRP